MQSRLAGAWSRRCLTGLAEECCGRHRLASPRLASRLISSHLSSPRLKSSPGSDPLQICPAASPPSVATGASPADPVQAAEVEGWRGSEQGVGQGVEDGIFCGGEMADYCIPPGSPLAPGISISRMSCPTAGADSARRTMFPLSIPHDQKTRTRHYFSPLYPKKKDRKSVV